MTRLMSLAAALLLAPPLFAADLGDDGLHKPTWLRETFKDLREDLAEANATGKRLLITVEQRGCIYCTQMHEEVYPDPAIDALIRDHYFVVQINLFGDVEVTDFDGTVLPEKEMAMRWGVMFTPTMIFLPEEVPQDATTAASAAVAMMPGAFGKGTTEALLIWVRDHGYESGENFQKFVADRMAAAALGNCVACHAIAALPNVQFPGNIGPPLDGVADRYTEAQLRGIVANAKMTFDGTFMPAFYKVDGFNRPTNGYTGKAPEGDLLPILSAQQIEDVVAYLLTLKE